MICGLQKMTLLDFPGKVACTVFLHGCNYRCPFCHNSELIGGKPEPVMDTAEFLKFLHTRKGLLDGVCVSGGEPTLYKELPGLLKSIKAMGFSVKLDTNGSHPALLRQLVEEGLVDYVAVDAKNSPGRYAETVGKENFDLSAVEQTLRYLLQDPVDYELRTTLVEPLHTEESIREMGQWLASLVPGKRPKRLFLQSFVDRDTVVFGGLSAPEKEKITAYAQILEKFAEMVTIRND